MLWRCWPLLSRWFSLPGTIRPRIAARRSAGPRNNGAVLLLSTFCVSILGKVLTTLWLAAIVAKAIAASVLVRRGLHRRYPALTAFLAFTAVNSAVLAWLHSDKVAYAWGWVISEPVIMLLLAGAGYEAFRRTTEHYKRFTGPSIVILAVAVAAAGVAALIAQQAPSTKWHGPLPIILIAQKYVFAGVVAMLAAAVALVPRVRTVPIRPSAERNACILITYCVGMLLTGLLQQSPATYPLAAYSSLLTGLWAACLWAGMMTVEADQIPWARAYSDSEVRQMDRGLRQLRRVARAALTCCR